MGYSRGGGLENMRERVSYCSLCAWRRDCKIKYRFQENPSLYCREYTRDLTIDTGEGESDHEDGKEKASDSP